LSIKPVLSPTQLARLVARCSSLPFHVFYKIAFILAYMALLRISNIAPPSFATFDPYVISAGGMLVSIQIISKLTSGGQKHYKSTGNPLL
jgi:hypothetical protein